MSSVYGVRRTVYGKNGKRLSRNGIHVTHPVKAGSNVRAFSFPSAVRRQPSADAETVLITGASGLLGRALVARFAGEGFHVLAQYRRSRGMEAEDVRWLAGDFSSAGGAAAFLKRHAGALAACSHVVHNYGPIAEKATAEVSGADLLAAYQAQLQPALDITRFLLARAPLRSVLFIGFEHCGRVRAYKKILAYAAAKNALLLLSRSLAMTHPGVRFNVFSPPSLQGAAVLAPGARPVVPARVAEKIYRAVLGRRSGCHYRWAPASQNRRMRKELHGQRKKDLPL